MAEQLMTELFFAHKPSRDGVLGEAEIAGLNQTLARLYCERAEETQLLPPPEPLPKGALRFPAFRTHTHRTLSRLCADADAKEQLLRRLVAEAGQPKAPVVAAKQCMATVAARAPKEAGPAARAIEAEAADVPECWTPDVLSVAQVREFLLTAVPAARAVEAEAADVPECWTPDVLSVTQVRDFLLTALGGDAKGDEAAAAAGYGLLAAGASKQVLEAAKVYGLSALLASRSFSEQLMRGETAAAAVSLLRRLGAGEKDAACNAAAQKEASLGRVVSLDDWVAEPAAEWQVSSEPSFVGTEDEQPDTVAREAFSFSPPSPGSPRMPSQPLWWRYDAGDGLHMDIRAVPDVNGPRTGHVLEPGEEFLVKCEQQGADGLLYLQLANGRGWVFESKPSVGTMCERAY